MIFKTAVEATSAVRGSYRSGLKALEERDRGRVECRETRKITGSLNLDRALEERCPNDPRWDYGIGFSVATGEDKVYWLEVHPASSHHVHEVLDKLAWLRTWLEASAPELNRLDREFVWVASGAVALPSNAPKRKLLAQRGLRLESRLTLK